MDINPLVLLLGLPGIDHLIPPQLNRRSKIGFCFSVSYSKGGNYFNIHGDLCFAILENTKRKTWGANYNPLGCELFSMENLYFYHFHSHNDIILGAYFKLCTKANDWKWQLQRQGFNIFAKNYSCLKHIRRCSWIIWSNKPIALLHSHGRHTFVLLSLWKLIAAQCPTVNYFTFVMCIHGYKIIIPDRDISDHYEGFNILSSYHNWRTVLQ